MCGCGPGETDLGIGFAGVVAEGDCMLASAGEAVGVESGDRPSLFFLLSFFFNSPNSLLFSFWIAFSPEDV
jgi:hypothetical protein